MIRFANPGTADIRALTVIGVNVKAGSAIGEFGTGFKYAVSKVLALGGKIEVGIGCEYGINVYKFTTAPVTIRWEQFSLVVMSKNQEVEAVPLGFTTTLGKHWEPWMAYRELRSNMMDEGGSFDWQPGDFDEYTVINVECPEVEAAHAEGGRYFLEGEALWTSADLEVHPAREDRGYFYRGIKVGEFARPGVFTYNILSRQQLTEDRTLGLWHANYAITQALAKCEDRTTVERVLLAPDTNHEAKLDWDYIPGMSQVFRETIQLQRYNSAISASAARRAQALYSDDFAPKALPMTNEDHQRVAQAKDLFVQLGLEWPWDALCLADLGEDGDDTRVFAKMLWVDLKAWGKPSWLQLLLEQRRFPGWERFREEEWLLRIIKWALPEHPLLQGDLEVLYGVEKAAEESKITPATPLEHPPYDDVPF